MKEDIIELIELAKSSKYKICIYGAGNVGRNTGYQLIKELDIKPDFYCDKRSELIGTIIKDGIPCICLDEVMFEKTIFFTLVSAHLAYEVEALLRSKGVMHIVSFMELIELKSKNYFAFFNRKQIAVYTCVCGDYDVVKEPIEISDKCDYFLISDKRPNTNSIYQYIDIKDYLNESNLDNTKINRFYKINPHLIFPQYRYSIYFDGNVQFTNRLLDYINKIPDCGLIATSRPQEESIYAEGLRNIMLGRDDKNIITKQLEEYYLAGMPEDYGLILPNVMIREHNNPRCISIMEKWWQELKNHSRRDMISLPYVLWNLGYKVSDVGVIFEERSKQFEHGILYRDENHSKNRIVICR